MVMLIVTAALLLARDRAMILVHPPRLPVTIQPESAGFTDYRTVTFQTEDGIDLRAWYMPPPDDGGAVVIFVHGLGGNRQLMLQPAETVYQHGYGALLLDLRNHGESGGEISTLGYYEPRDTRAALDFLLAQPEVDPEQIGIFGESLGAITALRAAAQMPELRAVVAQSAFTSIEENVASGVRRIARLPPFPFAPLVILFGEMETGLRIGLVRPVDEIAQIAPRAVLLMHGGQDQLLGSENSQRLYEAAGEPKELVYFPEAAHSGLQASDPELWERSVVSFFDRYLREVENNAENNAIEAAAGND
jgi:dipeptidyl aminopeptidase/acylaminoacyl peptidase